MSTEPRSQSRLGAIGRAVWLCALVTRPGLSADVEAGRAIYFDGRSADGQQVTTALADGTPLPGIACTACHRPSGLGSSEGNVFVPPIAGTYLFDRQESRRIAQYRLIFGSANELPQYRQPYDDESLARAITAGIGVGERELTTAMPRYDLNDEDLANLIAYLKSIDTAPAPGVTDEVIHFATIIDSSVADEKQNAVAQLLETFFRDHNALTRNEIGRKERGPDYKKYQYSSYRQWRLHVWQLDGPADSWPAQLERHYDRLPVFAVLGGVVGGDFAPVHTFCERERLPCLFPNTPLPATDLENHYTLYFSRGVVLEADVLSAYLTRVEAPPSVPVVHQLVLDDDPVGLAAAARLREHADSAALEVVDLANGPTGAVENLMIWGAAESFDALAQSPHWPTIQAARRVFVSGTLADDAVSGAQFEPLEQVYAIYPFALPADPIRRRARARYWLRAKGIAVTEEQLQIGTHFVVAMAGAALTQMLDNFSREYLIENLEHMAENAVTTAVYPRLSLGPGQRFASKGAYIIPLAQIEQENPVEASTWIIP